MIGWFANAMMAMHDHLKRSPPTTEIFGMPVRLDPTMKPGEFRFEAQVKNYSRTFAQPGGGFKTVEIPECRCGNRRGPSGGVCACCGRAIPSPEEHGRKPKEPTP